MRQLPPKILEEIYFKSVIPAVIYGIVVLGNCSSAMLNSLNPIHERAARLIHDQDDLQSLNWLPLSYFYNRRLLLFMFDVIKHNVPDDLASLLPGPGRRLAPVIKCNAFLCFQSYIVRDISLTEIYRWLFTFGSVR